MLDLKEAPTTQAWEPSYRLGHGCKIKHGFAFKGTDMTTDGNRELPIVVNIGNFKYNGGFRFESTKIQRYTGEYDRQYELVPGDILLIMTCQTPGGEILGVPGRIPNDGETYLHNQRMGLVQITDPETLDPGFLYYLFLSPELNGHLYATSTGAKILHTSPGRIEDFRFSRPPLETQRQIADILSAYDDLIENNTRRIQILEEMARTIYREWFVHFRYPGHESDPLVDSPIGPVPEGWEVASFSDLLDSYLGGDWGSEEPTGSETEEVVIIRGTDIPDATAGTPLNAPNRYISSSSVEKRRLRVGDVVVENSVNAKSRSVGTSLRITSGLLRRIGADTICASFCKNFRLRDVRLAPLLHLHLQHLRDTGRMDFYQNVATNGIANFQAKRIVSSEHLVFPSEQSVFDSLIAPLEVMTGSVYADQCSVLRLTRDLLLPSLLSGGVNASMGIKPVVNGKG